MSLAQLHRKLSFDASLKTRGVEVRKRTTGETPVSFKALINDLGRTSQDFTIDAGEIHATEIHAWKGTTGLDGLQHGDVMQELDADGQPVREHTIRRVQPEAQKIVLKCTIEDE